MLQQVLEYVHNWFIKTPYVGKYSISGGVISPLDFLIEGQRFWITGSTLNDGVYTYHANGCTNDDDTSVAGFADEDFTGVICALAVPPAVIALSADISGWVSKYGDVINSPYQSESFGGYSYEKQTMSKVGGGSPTMSWQQMFATRLNTWRKLC